LASDNDIEEAFFALCEIYRYGEGDVGVNLEHAVEVAKTSADREHFRGLIQYAELLDAGIGIERDSAKAAELLTQANARHFVSDQNNYALALKRGKGCRQRLSEAVKYYRIAADNGSTVAMHGLGFCYAKGKGVTRDAAEAARWYRRSADAGNTAACASYSKCLRFGLGVTQTFKNALQYLHKGA
jgi:TPR repeat protein